MWPLCLARLLSGSYRDLPTPRESELQAGLAGVAVGG